MRAVILDVLASDFFVTMTAECAAESLVTAAASATVAASTK